MEQNHEASVRMFHNNDIVANMYDRDYGGKNKRYAMFGQSVIVTMQVPTTEL